MGYVLGFVCFAHVPEAFAALQAKRTDKRTPPSLSCEASGACQNWLGPDQGPTDKVMLLTCQDAAGGGCPGVAMCSAGGVRLGQGGGRRPWGLPLRPIR